MGGGRYGYWGKEQRRKGAATSRIQRGCLTPAVARRGIPRERSLLLACCPHVTSALPTRVPLVIRSYSAHMPPLLAIFSMRLPVLNSAQPRLSDSPLAFGLLAFRTVWTLQLRRGLYPACAAMPFPPLAQPGRLEFLRRSERQTAAAIEEFAQTAVTGAALAAHDTGNHLLTRFPSGAATTQPIFPAYRLIDWDRGGF